MHADNIGDCSGEYYVQKTLAENTGYGIDIHFNRDVLLKDCSHCLWYSGYIASAYLDEYELRLMAGEISESDLYGLCRGGEY